MPLKPRFGNSTLPLPSIFSPSHCPHGSWGSVRAKKCGTPIPPTISSQGLLEFQTILAASSGVGITPTTFYPCRPGYRPVTLYCMRPQAIRGSLTRAHPSDTRFPKENQVGLRRLSQDKVSKLHASWTDIMLPPEPSASAFAGKNWSCCCLRDAAQQPFFPGNQLSAVGHFSSLQIPP